MGSVKSRTQSIQPEIPWTEDLTSQSTNQIMDIVTSPSPSTPLINDLSFATIQGLVQQSINLNEAVSDRPRIEDGDWYDLETFTSTQRYKGDTVALRRTTYIHLTTIAGQEEETGRYIVVNFDSDGNGILSTIKGRGLIEEMYLDELVGDSLVRLANDRPWEPGFDERLAEVRNMDKHSFEYELFFFNCESFANYLRSGVPFSGQVWSMNKTLSILTIVSVAITFIQKRKWNSLLFATIGAVTFYAHDTRLISLKKILEEIIKRMKKLKAKSLQGRVTTDVIMERDLTN